MRTIGTGNLKAFTTDDLRSYIGALALDVYESIALDMPDCHVAFSGGTLHRFVEELESRVEAVH
jgi:hypothetical protein